MVGYLVATCKISNVYSTIYYARSIITWLNHQKTLHDERSEHNSITHVNIRVISENLEKFQILTKLDLKFFKNIQLDS